MKKEYKMIASPDISIASESMKLLIGALWFGTSLLSVLIYKITQKNWVLFLNENQKQIIHFKSLILFSLVAGPYLIFYSLFPNTTETPSQNE